MSFRTNTLFAPALPSFADGIVKIDHTHDVDLYKIYQKVNKQYFPTTYSPSPSEELAQYQQLSAEKKQYMLIRNPLLLSRLFIRNASLNELDKHFKDDKEIRILDIGCGYAANLMGILAYFGPERVKYLGIDIYRENIQPAVLAYNNFPNVSFMTQDAIPFLENYNSNKESFNLILVQHPNFQSTITQSIFTKIFLNLKNALAPDGTIYSTFYSKSEVDYFQQYVQPHLDLLKGAKPIETHAYDENAKFVDVVTKEKQASEQFVVVSSSSRKNQFALKQ